MERGFHSILGGPSNHMPSDGHKGFNPHSVFQAVFLSSGECLGVCLCWFRLKDVASTMTLGGPRPGSNERLEAALGISPETPDEVVHREQLIRFAQRILMDIPGRVEEALLRFFSGDIQGSAEMIGVDPEDVDFCIPELLHGLADVVDRHGLRKKDCF